MDALFSSLLGNVDWYEIWLATLDTLLMLGGSLLFTIILGLPLGVLAGLAALIASLPVLHEQLADLSTTAVMATAELVTP